MERNGYEYLREYDECRVQELPFTKIDPSEYYVRQLDSGFEWFEDDDGQMFAAEVDEFANCCNLYWLPETANLMEVDYAEAVCCGHWCWWWEKNPFFQYESENRPWT